MYWRRKIPSSSTNKQLSTSKIVIINDLHLKAGIDGDPTQEGAIDSSGLNRYYYATPKLLKNFVEQMNIERPDHILVLGDFCDKPSDFPYFNEIWSTLEIPSTFTIGNHDLDDTSFSDLATILGYNSRPVLGGSPFNQTITIDENLIVMIDTTFDINNQHGNHYLDVCMHTDCFDWLEGILLDTELKNVVIATHVGFHGYHFNEGQRTLVKQLIARVKQQKPSLNIECVFGHEHKTGFEVFNNIDGMKGTLLPAMILYEDGRYTQMVLNKNGISVTKKELDYN